MTNFKVLFKHLLKKTMKKRLGTLNNIAKVQTQI
jgi:hypothetical protein